MDPVCCNHLVDGSWIASWAKRILYADPESVLREIIWYRSAHFKNSLPDTENLGRFDKFQKRKDNLENSEETSGKYQKTLENFGKHWYVLENSR